MKKKEFGKRYWELNYSEPSQMDGVGNAKEHAQYLKSLLRLEMINIDSIIDFGFGPGKLFMAMLKAFRPYRAYGIEPSLFVFEKVKKRSQLLSIPTKLKLEQKDLVRWAKSIKKKSKHFDLGICTSVFQYLMPEEIEFVLPVMASQVKYLYFSVPTNKELDRQKSDLDFFDEYAYRRSRTWYQKALREHFTFIGNRVLESKKHFSEKSTVFSEFLYRF